VRANTAGDIRLKTQRWKLLALTTFLHLAQPAARLWGRLSYGLAPLRLRDKSVWVFPGPRNFNVWSERWKPSSEWLESVESTLEAKRARTWRGGEYDRWDLQVSEGLFGGARLLMAVEEHGAGRQLLRFKVWPEAGFGAFAFAFPGVLAIAALLDRAWIAAALAGALALGFAFAAILGSGIAAGRILAALETLRTRSVSDLGIETVT
jgi:hypothetical protein